MGSRGVVVEAFLRGKGEIDGGADEGDEIAQSLGVAIGDVVEALGRLLSGNEGGKSASNVVDMDAVGDFFSTVDEAKTIGLKSANERAFRAVDTDEAGDGDGHLLSAAQEVGLDVATHLAKRGLGQ